MQAVLLHVWLLLKISAHRSLSIKTHQKLKVSQRSRFVDQHLAVNKSGAQMGTVHPRLCPKGRSYRNNKLNRINSCGPGVGKRDELLMNS